MSDRISPLTAEQQKMAAEWASGETEDLDRVDRNNVGLPGPLEDRSHVVAIAYAVQESQPRTEADVERVARAIEFYVGATASKTFKDSAARAAILAMGKLLPEVKTDA